MKRIAVLLVVLVALAWIGSKLAPRSEPRVAAAGATAVEAPPGSGQAPETTQVQPDRPMTPAEKKAQQEQWFGAETIVAARRAVREQLNDPDSAEFKDERANYTEEFGIVACGRVNAKNGFGGYTGFHRFVFGGGRVILEGRDNVADAWVGACL